MQTKCTAPSRDTRAQEPSVLERKLRQEARVAAVAAADPVVAEDPDVAGPGAGFGRHRWDHLVLGINRTLEDHVDFAGREAGEREIEVDVEHRQLAELELQQVEVPAGAERDLVVGDPQRPLLCLREMRQDDRRHLAQTEGLRREQPAVPGDDPALGVDQHRVGEAERPDRGGDLLDLPLRVRPGVARIGDKAGDRPADDRQRVRRGKVHGHRGSLTAEIRRRKTQHRVPDASGATSN
jgi:hypothetical protein